MVKQIIIGTVVVCTVGFVGLTVYNYSHETPAAAPQALGVPDKQQVFDLVNAERAKIGEAPLIDDVRLDASAEAKCADMVQYSYEAHVSPQGTVWTSFFYPELKDKLLGENLSWNYQNATGVVNGWMGSPEHKENILRPQFDHVGYAICGPSNGGLFNNAVVQHFAQI